MLQGISCHLFIDVFKNYNTNIWILFSPLGGDLTAPVISGCPSQVNAQAASGATSATATWTPPTATDNSGGVVVTSATHNPGDSFLIGTTTVTYTFTDPSGNFAACSFEVIVSQSGIIDNVAPVISNCPAGASSTAATGEMSAIVTWVTPTATDNSGVAPQVVASHNSGDVFDVGSTEVTYTFTDGSGNSAVCQFTVTVTAGKSTRALTLEGRMGTCCRQDPLSSGDVLPSRPT